MDLFHIQHNLIADRSADAWYATNIAGPFFHYRWQYGTSGGDGYSHIIGEHDSHAVLREEPSLTMSWGLEVDDDNRRRRFDWAQEFPDSMVRPFWVDFFWNNALIDRVELASIDGGRGTIPMPHWENTVTDYEMAVAFLINDLADGREYNPVTVVDSLGFTIKRDDNRWGAGSSNGSPTC
jgi:hypothetical protein